MASAAPKLILSPSRDIPFNKLVLSQSNVRRTKCGVSIGELADDIVRRTLLNSLNVRAVLDSEGNETGMFEVPAGGRRFRALELLVKTKRMAKTQAVPCVVREAGDVSAEEDSLAENIQRQQLHPLDQFRAMQLLVDQGSGVEEIAARFMTTPGIVRQRLRLANVSSVLHQVYADDGMTLEQLMAFSVTEDHARQEQVWEMIAHSHIREPYFIRRKLTEDTVRASDRRVRFVGIDAYVAAGGAMLRDLFEADDGGWVQDAALLDRMVDEKLKTAAEEVGAEGWKWVTAAMDLPYRCTDGMRELDGEAPPTSESEQARIAELHAEAEAIEAEFADADDMPEDVDQRITAIDEELAGLVERSLVYDPAEMARAGVLVSIDSVGSLYILRGFVRPEDEQQADAGHEQGDGQDGNHQPDTGEPSGHGVNGGVQTALVTVGSAPASEQVEEEDDVIKPLPDRLVSELTAHRTLALRNALANHPATAFVAVLHGLTLDAFYRLSVESCLELSVRHTVFANQEPGLKNSVSAQAIDARHAGWKARLPAQGRDLWAALLAFDADEQAALFAHCASAAVNALWEQTSRYNGRVSAHMIERRLEHSHVLARAVGLDMVEAGWKPTADNYLSRVTKPRILMAVTEARCEQTAGLIDHLKKGDMAKEAERLLDDSGWLPEPLRTPILDNGLELIGGDSSTGEDPDVLPAFLDEDADGTADDEDDLPDSYAIAAE